MTSQIKKPKEMRKISDTMIISNDREMITSGLFKCNPREDEILTIWIYQENCTQKGKYQWAPITPASATLQAESTHEFDGFFICLPSEVQNGKEVIPFLNFLEKHAGKKFIKLEN